MAGDRTSDEYQERNRSDLLSDLRLLMTNRVLWCVVVLAGIAQVVVNLEEARRGRYDVIALYLGLYLILVSFAVIKAIPLWIRASATPVVFFLIGVSELWLYTIVSNAMLYFLAAVLLIGVLVGFRAGWAMLFASLTVTCVFAALYIRGTLPSQPMPAHLTLSRPELAGDSLNWISIGIPFFFLSSALLLCFAVTTHALTQNYERANQLIAELRVENEERTKAVEALERSERSLRDAQRIAHIGSFEWDAVDDKVRWSDESYRIFDIDPDVIPDRSLVRAMTVPEDLPALDHVFERSESGTPESEVEFRIKRSGGEIRTIIGRVHSGYDENGKRIRLSGTVQDVTSERQHEEHERHLELQLQQSQKMEAVGHLAGGIAHDFNNILQSISGYCELAMMVDERTEEILANCLQQIKSGGQRGADLVEQLLAFSRKDIPERVPLRVSSALEGTLKFLRGSFAANIDVTTNIETEDDTVLANQTQVQQVITNLCTNAVQAFGSGGGTITITLSTQRFSKRMGTITGPLMPGDYVSLSVADTGAGIAPDDLDHIFDPFFTTKPVGEGTGLGLSMLHGIVLSIGGRIDVHSALGRGSTFTMYLPRYTETQNEGTGDAPIRPTLNAGDCKTVLVVDDEEPIATLIERYLTRIGLSTESYTDPLDALNAFQHNPEKYSIVLSDFTMPKLNGLDLADKLRSIDSGIPIILMSGRIDESLMESESVTELLSKPVRLELIQEAIQRNLSPM